VPQSRTGRSTPSHSHVDRPSRNSRFWSTPHARRRRLHRAATAEHPDSMRRHWELSTERSQFAWLNEGDGWCWLIDGLALTDGESWKIEEQQSRGRFPSCAPPLMARPSQRTRIGCSLTRCTNTDVWVMGRCVSDPSASQILAPATVSNTIRRDGMAKRTRNNGYRRLEAICPYHELASGARVLLPGRQFSRRTRPCHAWCCSTTTPHRL
jgi:hypothetical protein